MTDQWKDRFIRGGAIAVMTVAALGGMVGLTGVMAGYPGALRAGGILPRATGARHGAGTRVRTPERRRAAATGGIRCPTGP